MIKIVLIRHGQTFYNKNGLFCGWVDSPLTPLGRREALRAGKILKKEGFVFDLAFVSLLQRTSQTLNLILKAFPNLKLKIIRDWRLNERHYGALQGQSKVGLVDKLDLKQVLLWRRSYSVRPPEIKRGSRFDQSGDFKYRSLAVPKSESLRDVEIRMINFWRDQIIPALKQEKRIIISSSGNALRALVKHLDNLTVSEVAELNIPTGIPLVYELDKHFKVSKKYYLASDKELASAVDVVKNQTKKQKRE